MAITDLKPKEGKVELVAEVIEKEEPREFNKFGKTGRVCNATIKDETGQIKLTLWNDDCDKIKVGDKVQITNGYVNEFQGEMQLTAGKFGKLEVVGAAEISSEEKPKKEEKKPDKPQENIDVDEENLEEF